MGNFAIGDEVIINPDVDDSGRFTGIIWKVQKTPTRRSEVNYTLRERDGSRLLKTRAENLVGRDENGHFPKPKTQITTIEILPRLYPGTVVRMSGKDGLFVVTGTSGKPNTYRVFPLGGSAQYWRNVPYQSLTVVDPARIQEV